MDEMDIDAAAGEQRGEPPAAADPAPAPHASAEMQTEGSSSGDGGGSESMQLVGSPPLQASSLLAAPPPPAPARSTAGAGAQSSGTGAFNVAGAFGGGDFPSSLSQMLMGLGGAQSANLFGMHLGNPHDGAHGMTGLQQREIAESMAESLLGGSGALSPLFRGDGEASLFLSAAEREATSRSSAGWYSMNEETGEWAPLAAHTSAALEAVMRETGGEHVEINMDDYRFAGTATSLRLFPNNGSPPREVRRMTRAEAQAHRASGDSNDVLMEEAALGREGASARKQGLLVDSMPRTAADWQNVVERLCKRLEERPVLPVPMEEVQRTVHLLVDGRKSLKSRVQQTFRKGEMVFASGDGDDVVQTRRGVVETEHADGTYTVKWHSPLQETTRVGGMTIRSLNRLPAGQQSTRMLNQYLLQRAIPCKEPRMVMDLLREGADPCCADDQGNPAIALAVSKGCPVATLQALLQSGADTQDAGPLGSALQIAVSKNEVDAIECLLENGADATRIDTKECLEAVAEMIQRHKEVSVSEEEKAKVLEGMLGRLLPLVITATSDIADLPSQHSSVGFVSYVMDKAPHSVVEEVFKGTESKSPLDTLLRILVSLQGSESFDVIYYVLRIVMCLLDKLPALADTLRQRGIIRWVERLTNAAALRLDVQAGLLHSKSGRIKDKHISKLAVDVMSKAPATGVQTSSPQLTLVGDLLRAGNTEALHKLAEILTADEDGVSAHSLAGCNMAGALMSLLGRPGSAHWTAFRAAFSGAWGKRDKIEALVRPMINLITTEEPWPVIASSSDDLFDLVKPLRIELIQTTEPSTGDQSKAAAPTPKASPTVINVEPMLLLRELERHILLTAHPPREYLRYCHELVGATIQERPMGGKGAFTAAEVVAFELIPDDQESDAPPVEAGEAAAQSTAISFDTYTQAACLSLQAEMGATLITCNKKGSPAGTVQATRPFSPEADGPLAYYEVTIKRRGPSGAIGVGLARAGYSKTKMPGWEPVSHAWHGDDGCTFNSCGTGAPFSQPWSEGDVIGCGIDFRKRAIFLTRNGALQGAPFRGVDPNGLYATIGCQTKGECVSVSFAPPFLYDLATHTLTQPLVPVHHLRYDGGVTKMVNMLAREYVITSTPSHGAYGDRVRAALCSLKASTARCEANAAMRSLLALARAAGAGGAAAAQMPQADVARVAGLPGGAELLAVAGVQETGAVSPEATAELGVLLFLLEEADQGANAGTGKGGEEKGDDDAENRIYTVNIVIPDGFPPELFFEEVEDAVRLALSQPDPAVAPASGHVGDSYRWPDRGFDHEEAWYESLMSSLAEKQAGAVARGQTLHEAEVLSGRLSNVVQCELVTDDSEDYTKRAREAKRGQAGGGTAGFMIGDRIQVMEVGGDWVHGTVVSIENSRFGVMCDDGTWMPGVPIEQARGMRGGARGGARGGRHSLELQDLMYDSRGLDPRSIEHALAGGGRSQADLRRRYSCFDIGDINRDGYTAPKSRFDLSSEGTSLPPLPEAPHPESSFVPTTIRVSFNLASAPAGEMHKIKTAAQLRTCLEASAGKMACILFIDAPARPPAGQSWPRHIHSASTMVKELATRFGEVAFLRVLSGTCSEVLQHYGVPRTGFLPVIALLVDGVEEARWQQQNGSETIWLPCRIGTTDLGNAAGAAVAAAAGGGAAAAPSSPPAGGAPVGGFEGGMGEAPVGHALWKTVHRNEFGALIQRKADEWRSQGRLRACGDGALDVSKTVYECMNGLGAAEHGRASSNVFHYSLTVVPGTWQPHGPPGDAAAAARDRAVDACSMDVEGGEGKADESGAVSEAVRNSLELLSLLHRHAEIVNGQEQGGRLWESAGLTRRLTCQLHDTLAFASMSLPPWCLALPRRYPFLFSLDARRKLLDCTGFGSSHAVYRLQESRVAAHRAKLGDSIRAAQQRLAVAREHQDIDGIARATDDVDEIERRVFSRRIGAICSDLARVSRDRILDNARRLLEYHRACRHLLEVQFSGEDGFGSGVTQNFYESVSGCLQKRTLNQETPLWITDGHDVEHAAEPDGQYAYLTNAEGLFPQPLGATPDDRKLRRVCEMYRFMGMLLGKAGRDKFTVPLPLHPHFFVVLKGEGTYSPSELMLTFGRSGASIPQSEDWTSMDLLRAYATLCMPLQEGELEGAARQAKIEELKTREFTSAYLNRTFQCSLAEYLETTAACFVDPLTGEPVCDGGEARELTVQGLPEYVVLVAERWFGSGIRRQMAAFREGLSCVFPFESLQILSAAELGVLLCGERVIEWDRASLEKNLKLVCNEQGAKYTKDCTGFQLFLDELCEMSNSDRSRFLDFVTACPRLPPGGLASLCIEIAPESRSQYPRSRTCSNLMWLPSYATKEELHDKLHTALANSKDGGFHEHNEEHRA